MGEKVNVAVVRGDSRRGAAAQALALISSEIRERIVPRVLVKPNLVSHRRQLPSTHPETLAATLDCLLDLGARSVTVAEGASDATAGFERFGFHKEAWGRPVRFLDLNREEREWEPLELKGVDDSSRTSRVSRTITGSECRVSLTSAKTHVTSIVTLSLKNMLSSIHPDDRVMMHGYRAGNGQVGWKRVIVDILKADNRFVNGATRLRGRIRNFKTWARGMDQDGPDSFGRLSAADLNFLKSVETMNQNLVALTRLVKPHISVVDGFVAMHREGPRHGTPIPLGTVIAGTDAVAVDSVAAAVMGFDPAKIGYLVYAEAAGLGVADLDRIRILGDPIATVRRPCVPHSNFVVQRHWAKLQPSSNRRPHFRVPATSGAVVR